jgi:hypothetical protein
MTDSLDITGNFDGGNPQDPDAIIQTGAKAFTIIPFSEDNDPNYKFRLDLKVFNHSSDSIQLRLTIDWREPRFNYLRNYVYLKHSGDADWSVHPMQVSRTQSMGVIECRAGETYICLHPKYNYGDYMRFVAGIPESDFVKKEKIGLSPEGRELWMIKINSDSKVKKPIMIVARVHPYETSGSYCIEGIVTHFLANLSPIYLIPMANPDGVFNGFCKLTAVNGLDISKQNDPKDPLWCVLRRAVDQARPSIYAEFHNWMFPERDGLYFLNWFQAGKFIRKMPSQRRFHKQWKPMLRRKLLSIPPQGFKEYARDTYGALTLCTEYPWHHRTTADMKQLGADTLNALLTF